MDHCRNTTGTDTLWTEDLKENIVNCVSFRCDFQTNMKSAVYKVDIGRSHWEINKKLCFLNLVEPSILRKMIV